jgi:Cdc6-like AAA superfamily ATPase
MSHQRADGLVTDPAVFQETWLPADFVHREGELEHLSTALEPVLDGDPAGDVFVSGPSGSGKTSAARYLLGTLRESAATLDTHLLRCWSNRTRHRVLYSALGGFGSTADVQRTAVSASELLSRVEAAVDRPAIVVLDEVDRLATPDVLYDLYHVEGLSLYLIANSEDAVLARLEPRLRSRLGNATSVQFERYGLDALVAILAQRVEHGLRPGTVTRRHLERIADAAAGNARDAIRILATAARLAASRGRERLTMDCIEAAVPEASAELRETRREQLDEHRDAIYEVVTEAGSISPGEAYERYAERVSDPRGRRRVREYVNDLVADDLIAVSGKNRGRRYRAVTEAGRAVTEADRE